MPEAKAVNWQIPADSLPEKLWDVLIIGAGPAGATAAIRLAALGHATLLLDQDSFPRDKPCGDALVADALKSLQNIGLAEEVARAGHGMRLLSVFSSSQLEFEIPGAYTTLKRRVLDTMIARKAAEAGATFAQGRVVDLAFAANGLITATLAGTGKTVRARLGLLATGSRMKLLRKVDMAGPHPPSGFAMRCYVRSSLHLNHLVVSYDRSIIPGYAWIFPLGDGEYNIGCGVVYGPHGPQRPARLHEKFHTFLNEFPLLRSLMSRGQIISPLRGALLCCGLQGARPWNGRNLLAAGEAIGTTFPFTGEGIGKAMATGEMAAEGIHEALAAKDLGLLSQFPLRLERELKPLYQDYEIAQRWFAKAWLNDFVARRTQKSGFLSNSFAGVLTESISPHKIFSWSGMIRSYIQ
jgi:geranylgeranyl reductase family protein